MPKFTFKCEHQDCYTDEVEITNTTEFKGETLEDVIENFEMFLRGSGFVFHGHLDIVSEDNFELKDDYSEEIEKAESSAWPFPANDRPS